MKLPKETYRHGKWYGDACGAAFALELVGERWSLLVVRELLLGPRRFSDLRAGLPGISAKTLSERLDSLEAAGVLQRRELPPPAPAHVYDLTEWGYQAEDAILALGRWAAAHPAHDPGLPLSAASMMLSLRTMFDPAAARKVETITAAVRIAREDFRVLVRGHSFRSERGVAEAPDFAVEVPAAGLLAALVYGKRPAEELAAQGLTMSGNREAARRFINLFHLPEKARLPCAHGGPA